MYKSNQKKAIVTGISGYIAPILCRMLKEQGYFVIGCDVTAVGGRLGDAHKKYVDIVKYVDFCSDEFIKLISNYKDATVFHLAASSLLGPSFYNPEEYFFNNTVKTFKLLEFLNRNRFGRFIFASTAAVYSEKQIRKSVWKGLFGQNDLEQMQYPVKETDIINPPNNYGLSKLMTEQMIDSITKAQNINHEVYGKTNLMEAFSFRFFNVIGGYENMGHRFDTPHIMSQLIESYRLSNRPFYINGDNYKTKDGTCVRDYVHVMDVCRAMIHVDLWADDQNFREARHLKFNLGTGKGHTNKEVVDTFCKITSPHIDKKPFDVKMRGPRPGDPPYLVADPKLFIDTTGFTYKYSDNLESMIESAWRAYNV